MVVVGAVVAGVAVVFAASGAAQQRVPAAGRVEIAIHEQGMNADTHLGRIAGKFSIDLALVPSGHTGTTRITTELGHQNVVEGQMQIGFAGNDTLTSKNGTLTLAFQGVHIPINNKAKSNGETLGPDVEHGTWRIKTASGVYAGWKGGGLRAALLDGYEQAQSYSVEWDGMVTR
jgi:hypothetical protein